MTKTVHIEPMRAETGRIWRDVAADLGYATSCSNGANPNSCAGNSSMKNPAFSTGKLKQPPKICSFVHFSTKKVLQCATFVCILRAHQVRTDARLAELVDALD